MKFNLLAVTCGLVISSLTFAESLSSAGTYQAEAFASAARTDLAHSDDHVSQYTLGGTYYFNVVKTNNLPLAEAAYLGQNSYVSASAADFSGPGKHLDGHIYNANVAFFIPESFLYVAAGISRVTSDVQHDNDWGVTVGVTPIDGLLITTSYSGDNGYDANIHAKYATQLGGHFVNLEAGAADKHDGENSVVTLGGDFYLDNTFSVGGEIASSDNNDRYTLRTRKFFTQNFSGSLNLWDDDKDRGLVVGAAYRF